MNMMTLFFPHHINELPYDAKQTNLLCVKQKYHITV